MKQLFLVLSLAVLFSTSAAHAQDVNADVNIDVKATTTGNGAFEERRNENSKASDTEEPANDRAAADASVSGNATAEAHRSAVATFVQSLHATADRNGGIGAEVRAVAQSQNDLASTTVDAMAKIENRNKIASFLFGTDWKSIGSLRSAIAQNAADISRLEKAATISTDASVRADLEAEIETLKDQQGQLEDFVTSHEENFSLFGWFTKLFVTAEA